MEHFAIFCETRVRDVYTFNETLVSGRGEFLMDLQKKTKKQMIHTSYPLRKKQETELLKNQVDCRIREIRPKLADISLSSVKEPAFVCSTIHKSSLLLLLQIKIMVRLNGFNI